MLPAAAALLLFASPAHADWTIGGYLGSSWTSPATLTLDQPSQNVHVTWTSVDLDSRSFESPPYYGYRVTWFPSERASIGVSGELTHLKVYARAGALEPEIQRFSISHGLNLVLANVIWRQPPASGRRVRLTARAGAGFAVPHGESQVFGVTQEQYQVSGFALQGAVGPVFRLTTHLNALAEYKLTTAAPTVDVPDGTIKGRYTSQHVAAGLEVAW